MQRRRRDARAQPKVGCEFWLCAGDGREAHGATIHPERAALRHGQGTARGHPERAMAQEDDAQEAG